MINRHHVLFSRRAWESSTNGTLLRQKPSLIVPLEVDIHNELHRSLSHVPPLPYYLGKNALRNYEEYDFNGDYVEAVENLQRSIEDATRHPRADLLEREVGQLAIYALEIQKPFVEEAQ